MKIHFFKQDSADDRQLRRERHQKDLEEFKTLMEQKREQRKLAISRISDELNSLRRNKDDLEKEKTLRIGLERQVQALKEVSTVSNEMLQLRETQVHHTHYQPVYYTVYFIVCAFKKIISQIGAKKLMRPFLEKYLSRWYQCICISIFFIPNLKFKVI